jgi:AraC-like DNA-binding protein
LVARAHVGAAYEGLTFERWLEPPQPAVTLMVSFGSPFRTDRGTLPGAWIAGLDDRPEMIETADVAGLVDVKLTPLGAARVCDVPLREISRSVVALEDVFGPDGRRLAQTLEETDDWDVRFALVDRFLARRAATGRGTSPFVARAWRRLEQTSGTLRIGALARELGCSRRHLSVRFHEELGLPPKTAARVLRFHAARARIADKPARWADIAHELGYADQSHLNREFRELAGTTPADLAARWLPDLGLVGDGITLVRDDARVAA